MFSGHFCDKKGISEYFFKHNTFFSGRKDDISDLTEAVFGQKVAHTEIKFMSIESYRSFPERNGGLAALRDQL